MLTWVAGDVLPPVPYPAEGGGAYEYIRRIYDYFDSRTVDSLHSEHEK